MPDRHSRLIVPRNSADQVRRIGLRTPWRSDLYHRGLTLHWAQFLALGCAVYLMVNVAFGALYMLEPGAVAGARPGSFEDSFFFSVQTIATIGYGQMFPATPYANVLVTLETMAGLIFAALTTGIVFARISRPTARVMFANTLVIAPFQGTPTLQARIANERRSQILEADVHVILLRYERSVEGVKLRRFHDLKLARSHTPVFALSFTILHTIDETSPLWGATQASLMAEEAEILVTVTGLEETTSQNVHARTSYLANEIHWDRRFTDIFATDEAGNRVIDYSRFHVTDPA